jgi:NADPH:quinone reductase-like Zn-dependent oxidoreductase
MKAVVQDEYGSDKVLKLSDVERPVPKEDEVLVRVENAALHIGDLMLMKGEPYVMRLGAGLRRPKKRIPGFDFAGVVESAGAEVAGMETGDEVFGEAKSGSCAEYLVAAADSIAPKPTGLNFAEAAAIPVSGVTALRGIRDAGKAKPGDKVLVNGATGGVGIYAVQIAKSLGAEVTAICGPSNVELARQLGADHVIDYTAQDYTEGGPRYDLILDNVANRPLADARKAVAEGGTLISNSARSKGRWLGAVGRMTQAAIVSVFIKKQGRPFYSPVRRQDLLDLTEMINAGGLRAVIDRSYPLAETPAAMEYIATGHASGKTVIEI